MDTVCAPLAFIDGLGTPEMMLIFVIILVLFGGQKLPEFARGLGKTMREFKKAASGVEEEFKRALEEDERKRTVAASTQPQSTTPALTSGSENPPGYGSEDPHGYENQEEVYSDAGPDAPAHDTWPKADSATPPTEQPAESTAATEIPPEKNLASSDSIPASSSQPETVPASETLPADLPSGEREKKLPPETLSDAPKP